MTVVVSGPRPAPPLIRSNDVFILGSGFSKSISPDLMPTLGELGERVGARFQKGPGFNHLPQTAAAALRAGRMPSGNLESWLSHLATPAPFLSELERLYNTAIAEELAELIVDEIARSQKQTLERPIPPWLPRLVSLWDRRAATVVTFNYDTLVEYAVADARMPWVQYPRLDGTVEELSSLQLHKLHGSISWYRTLNDRVGTSLAKMRPAGIWGEPEKSNPPGGMVPLVVPPLATKSDYYDLSVVRAEWQLARAALAEAKRLVLMGYSTPMTDLAVVALLSQYLAAGADIQVIDVDPGPVVKRLRSLGLKPTSPFDGADAIARFVDGYEVAVSRDVASALLPVFDSSVAAFLDTPVVAYTARQKGPPPPVKRIDIEADKTVIVASDDTLEVKIYGRDLQRAVQEAADGSRRLVLKVGDQPERAVLNITQRVFYANLVTVET